MLASVTVWSMGHVHGVQVRLPIGGLIAEREGERERERESVSVCVRER